MLTFLFWNLNGKDLVPAIARLVAVHEVDVLVLAEFTGEQITPMLLALNPEEQAAQFHYAPSECDRIAIFTRFPSDFIKPIVENSRYTIRKLTLSTCEEILFVAAHLLSLLNASAETLDIEAMRLAQEIRVRETEAGHSRTIVVGDLNMNPFSSGVVSANGLHGVMTQNIARKGSRIVQGREYPFFFNPMWGHLGDKGNTPAGTYYYRKSDHVCYFWNTFDQVLIRPDLLDYWDEEFLQILTTDGQQSFLTSNSSTPNSRNFSDHLPLLFRLSL
ncbi:endonuclease/exonuclease/phosphatase family protein [Tumidithrix elongata RA019]|uniref:Endonuclease/exonuclease/phosphatase family protein n=1 Tax=Tumidithrix elongata BACA0141 TaxID=2716417 RepID=A0AAW9Q0Y3_9CYAN|nr:endonuclease/exonuclease/phosphatase family protein [Tumidithrix elongata RA019]